MTDYDGLHRPFVTIEHEPSSFFEFLGRIIELLYEGTLSKNKSLSSSICILLFLVWYSN